MARPNNPSYMKIYISGKIGTETITDEIRDKFNAAAAYIQACGHEAVNPVDIVHQSVGGSYLSHNQVSIDDLYTRHLLYDLALISTCDAIYLLPDWQDSPGAKAEFAFAAAIGKKVAYSIDKRPFHPAFSHTFSMTLDEANASKLASLFGLDVSQ